ncbi:NAD-dependent epimerase/dehydratase family protein [Nocardia sp. NPDC051832]|uniref:NAD-dependent epimerase/dehydratase family protein n=1 Tax=Nocardia sp. NPDC051832 TaxID=3155673 RepID=UPI00343ADCA1
MKVAVTGAAGYLGSNLLPLLVAAGHEVTAIDRAVPEHPTDPRITWVSGNVLDPASMRDVLAGNELVYHLVAVITLSEKNDLAWKVNTEGVRVVAEAALAAGVRRMVHTSSIHAFNQYTCGGRIDESTVRSTDPALPVYDRSKWQGEIELRKVIDQGLDAVICNPTGVYGPADFCTPLSRVNKYLKDASLGKVPAMISGGFDMVDVRDVALGLTLAAQSGRTGENYLLGSEMVTTIDLCRMAASANGRKGPRFEVPVKLVAGVMPVLEPIGKLFGSEVLSKAALGAIISAPIVDHGKATKELGYQPRSTEDTVRDLVAFFNDPAAFVPEDTRRIA